MELLEERVEVRAYADRREGAARGQLAVQPERPGGEVRKRPLLRPEGVGHEPLETRVVVRPPAELAGQPVQRLRLGALNARLQVPGAFPLEAVDEQLAHGRRALGSPIVHAATVVARAAAPSVKLRRLSFRGGTA